MTSRRQEEAQHRRVLKRDLLEVRCRPRHLGFLLSGESANRMSCAVANSIHLSWRHVGHLVLRRESCHQHMARDGKRAPS